MIDSQHNIKRIYRYGLFGVITAGLEFTTFILLDPLMHIYLSSMLSFLVGIAASFLFNKFMVFKNSNSIAKKEVLQFTFLGLVNSQLSSLVTWMLYAIVPSYAAKIISMVLIAVWNYLIMNFVIFRKQQTSE